MTRATLARARAMSLRDWRDFFECGLTLAGGRGLLRVRSPARVVGPAALLDGSRPPLADREIRRWTRLVDAAGRHLVPASCLTRSIALSRVLARRGVAAAVRIGVRNRNDRME